jgi:hypothetical protein
MSAEFHHPVLVIALVVGLTAVAAICVALLLLRLNHVRGEASNVANRSHSVGPDAGLRRTDRLLPSIEGRARHAWFGGIVVAIAILGLTSWTARRDEADRIADAALRDPRLSQLLARTRCPPPAAPLEKMLVTIATQADGKPPAVFCTYVTAPLGALPQIRNLKPMLAGPVRSARSHASNGAGE